MAAARQFIVIALVFFAVIGMVSSAGTTTVTAKAPAAAGDAAAATSPSTDNSAIGNTDGSATDAAPVGGPVSPGTFTTVSPASGPGDAKSAASSSFELSSSTFLGAVFATVAGALFV